MNRFEVNKNAKKNILIGKIGKTVRFKNTDVRKGGDTPVILFSAMAKMNPDFNFFLIGPNQLNKLTDEEYDYVFPNHNVYSAHSTDYDNASETFHPFDPILNYFKERNITPDFGLIMYGMSSQTNIPNYTKSKKTGEYASPLNAFKNYAGPYLYVLNKLGTPWYGISEDARYITVNAGDLFNHERLVFSQINDTFEPTPHGVSEDDRDTLVTEKIDAVYAFIERIFLMGIKRNWKDDIDIDRKVKSTRNKLIVISNGCGNNKCFNRGNGGKSSRLPVYKQYILDNLVGTEYEGTKIYGQWDDKVYEKYPGKIEDKKLVDLGDEVADAKYSLVYSIMPGFVTVKPWEMIIKGLVPFIHPDYDPKRLLGLPEFIYLKDEKDLIEKMRLLDSDENAYRNLMNELFACIDEDDLNGKRINNAIFTKVAEDLGFDYEEKNGIKDVIFDRYAKNMIAIK